MKLKKLLQILHSEINQSGMRLELRGGLDTLNRLMNPDETNHQKVDNIDDPDDSSVTQSERGNFDDLRKSVSMSQLL